jgi:hypothetical protein
MPTRKLSFLLNGGVDNRTVDELIAPVVQQGQAPMLKVARNVRLSKTIGGVARAPSFEAVTTQRTQLRKTRGFVSSLGLRNTLVLSGPRFNAGTGSGYPEVIAEGGRVGVLDKGAVGSDGNFQRQRGAMPVRVRASQAMAALTCGQYALGYNESSGLVIFAAATNVSTNPTSPQTRLLVGARTPDGALGAPPATIANLALPAHSWVGVTCHGANGDRVWFVSQAGDICYQAVQYGDYGMEAVGSPVVVVAFVATAFGVGAIDVVASADGTHAYLVHADATTPANGVVRQVSILTGATGASSTIANAMLGGGYAAVSCATLSGDEKVAATFASVSASLAYLTIFSSAFGASVSATPAACRGRVALAFNNVSGTAGPYVSWLVEENPQVLSTSIVVRLEPVVVHRLVTVSAGTVPTGTTAGLPWYRIAGRSGQWGDAGEGLPATITAVHQLVPRNAITNEAIGASNYCDDPSLDLFWVKDTQPSLLTRLGVVRGSRSGIDHLYGNAFASSSLLGVGDDLLCSYRLLEFGVSTSDARAWLTTLDMGEPDVQLSPANDSDGGGMLGGALPLQWDGCDVAELGAPTHTPVLRIDKITSGAAAILAAGDYAYQAVIYWTDSSGLVHRSRPSKLVLTTFDGATERAVLSVGVPWSFVPAKLTARVYSTDANGTALHLLATLTWPNQLYSAMFSAFQTAAVDTAAAQIYSGGGLNEEIVPQPPPPAFDLAVVGQRCWIVDAEHRSRLVPSKMRVAGVGYEFAPGLEVVLPAGAGRGVAVREWRGTPIVLTEQAVYQVSGEGPSNTLGGSGSFAPPVKVSDIGCTNPASVVVCPGGILWQSGNRFVLLGDSGVSYVSTFGCTHDVSAAVCLRKYSEVLFFSSTQLEVRVYHYDTGKWSTYDAQALPGYVLAAHTLPYDADSALLATLESSTPTFRRVDAESVSSAANIVLETDWVLLGGDFQDHVDLRRLVFNGRLAGPHNIQLDLFVDYKTTADTTRTWTASELDAIDVNGNYSLKIEASFKGARAITLRVTDTLVSGAGCVPRSVTLVYDVMGQLREEVFVPGSFK